ncbi:hypothetical protein [Kibdelosporangium philippinense]|uniref:hypothetical protein n=1 Tax=Kibdelosporangium philippinense TaxID=211113 RepID=UPI003605B7DA
MLDFGRAVSDGVIAELRPIRRRTTKARNGRCSGAISCRRGESLCQTPQIVVREALHVGLVRDPGDVAGGIVGEAAIRDPEVARRSAIDNALREPPRAFFIVVREPQLIRLTPDRQPERLWA